MDMSVGRFAEARGERRVRVQGAVIAGAIVGACMIAVPAGLLDLLVSSTGLSEFVPVLAPPVGWPVRIALALLGAAVAVALSLGSGTQDRIDDRQTRRKRNAIMGWTQSLGLHHLARLARGQGSEPVYRSDPRVAITPDMRSPRLRRSPQDKVQDTLARHRADLHPDAPPRAPLMASRDLPVVAELTVVETLADHASAPEPLAPLATPIRDTTDQVRPRPLPRAPEPFSDSDLNWMRGLLDAKPEADVQAQPVSSEPLSSILPETSGGVTGAEVPADASLLSMLDRFENGVSQRIALRDAADAKVRIEDTLAGPLTSAPVVVAPTASPVEQPEMDAALSAALETLKALSAKANGR
ncbi:MAG TPA: hypothetical protein VF475_14480 [Sphingobium sp.]